MTFGHSATGSPVEDGTNRGAMGLLSLKASAASNQQ